MRNSRDSQATGCGVKIVSFVFTIIFGAAFIGSLWIMPAAQRIALETVCKPGTIVYDKWTNRRKTPTCIDKKTGRKTDVAIYEIFGCCPLGLVVFLILIYSICMILFQRISRASNNNSPSNY